MVASGNVPTVQYYNAYLLILSFGASMCFLCLLPLMSRVTPLIDISFGVGKTLRFRTVFHWICHIDSHTIGCVASTHPVWSTLLRFHTTSVRKEEHAEEWHPLVFKAPFWSSLGSWRDHIFRFWSTLESLHASALLKYHYPIIHTELWGTVAEGWA